MKKRDIEHVGAMARRLYQNPETAGNSETVQKILEGWRIALPEKMYPDLRAKLLRAASALADVRPRCSYHISFFTEIFGAGFARK